MTTGRTSRRRVLTTRSTGTVITDPELLASLRPSPEAIAEIERIERAAMAPRPRILLD